MASIALVGPDGAGKTTICRMLQASGTLPFCYIYMGSNVRANTVSLPLEHLAERMRSAHRRHPKPFWWAPVRLVHRIAEQAYRLGISALYQRRGFTVLYDRHPVLDNLSNRAVAQKSAWTRSLYDWFLNRIYPRPDFVIYLDAPAEILFARKGESSPVKLERRRQSFLQQAAKQPNFAKVDATQPLEAVYNDVLQNILNFVSHRGKTLNAARSDISSRHSVG